MSEHAPINNSLGVQGTDPSKNLAGQEVKPRIFIKQKGSHKAHFYGLVYYSGKQAKRETIRDNKVLYSRMVEIQCKDKSYSIDQYAEENGFIECKETDSAAVGDLEELRELRRKEKEQKG